MLRTYLLLHLAYIPNLYKLPATIALRRSCFTGYRYVVDMFALVLARTQNITACVGVGVLLQ